jgi:hypothetical protein
MTTDEILSRNKNKVFVELRSVHDEDSDLTQQYVLIEGDANAFKFLGELFTAMSIVDPEQDCSRTVHPEEAGSAHFVEGSNLGFMLHRNDRAHGSKI